MANKFLQQSYPKAQSTGLNALGSINTGGTKTFNAGVQPSQNLMSQNNMSLDANVLPIADLGGTNVTTPQPDPWDMDHTTQVQNYLDANPYYDPSKDPVISQVNVAGQANLDAGLMALRDTFADQRAQVEGRSFRQGLGGSGIEEGLYNQQYKTEQQQIGQTTADMNASTQAALVDATSQGRADWQQGWANSVDEAKTMIQWEIDNGMLTVEQGKLDIMEIQAENDRVQTEINQQLADEEARRTALDEAFKITDGGRAMEDYLIENYGSTMGWDPTTPYSPYTGSGGEVGNIEVGALLDSVPPQDREAVDNARSSGITDAYTYINYRGALGGTWKLLPDGKGYQRQYILGIDY